MFLHSGDELILLECTTTESQPLVGNDLAYLVHDVLADEVLRRSEYGYPNALSIGHPVGGLLASSNAGQQRWALGYTAQLVAGVWIGSDTGDALPLQTAGSVWHALMTYALLGQPAVGWETPDNIISMTVCSPSGLLPTTACQQLVNEIFIEGNQPVQLDNLYQSFAVNRETGRLATVFTPLALVDERIFMVVPAEAQLWALKKACLSLQLIMIRFSRLTIHPLLILLNQKTSVTSVDKLTSVELLLVRTLNLIPFKSVKVSIPSNGL